VIFGSWLAAQPFSSAQIGRQSPKAAEMEREGSEAGKLELIHFGPLLDHSRTLAEHLGARTLILTGLLADSCILFTAQDE
jgi:nicotinamidase-related amidase